MQLLPPTSAFYANKLAVRAFYGLCKGAMRNLSTGHGDFMPIIHLEHIYI